MTLVLHFGVIDLPYSFNAPVIARGRKRGKRPSGGQTTGDVAGWLENKYHVMEHYYQAKKQPIADALAEALSGHMETLLMGGPVTGKPLESAMGIIEDGFKKFLSTREIERLGYPGIPTKAALAGVSHRFKRKKGPRRPSFIDTGLYQSSFKVWTD